MPRVHGPNKSSGFRVHIPNNRVLGFFWGLVDIVVQVLGKYAIIRVLKRQSRFLANLRS